MYLFVFKLCVYDYVIFKADGIELRTPFKKKAVSSKKDEIYWSLVFFIH